MKKLYKNNNPSLFSSKDFQQIRRLGQHLNTVQKQIDMYRRGPVYLNLKRPCTVNDGILSLSAAQRRKLISFYEKNAENYKLMKFVPASGAASRMFADWFSLLDSEESDSMKMRQLFLKNLKRYPFYSLLNQNKRTSQFIQQKDVKALLDYILSSSGLQYGRLPKALIPFHFYTDKDIRTAMEEHLYEAAHYVCGAGNVCDLHFTISPEHEKDIIKKIKSVKSECQKLYSVKYKISYSFQSPSTNVLAVDEHGLPFRDNSGHLVFRPGGHGTLLKNLNTLNADFIFIRNIDNIAPQPLWKKIVPCHKMMGGLAMQMQKEIFANLRLLSIPDMKIANIDKIQNFCCRKLNIDFPRNFKNHSRKDRVKILFSMLNRPLRICGVVRNNKEPGGGPFWIKENDGALTMQIVESAHVDKRKADQLKIWSEAQYFNPVDMVCCIKDYRGKKFNLKNYVNENSYIISNKKEKGLNIKALEMPGLWNGSMAYWNTIFVKIPLFVFNPVKSVNDLLRPSHLIS